MTAFFEDIIIYDDCNYNPACLLADTPPQEGHEGVMVAMESCIRICLSLYVANKAVYAYQRAVYFVPAAFW